MKYRIKDTISNILTSLFGLGIVTFLTLCVPRDILHMRPFPKFPPSFENVSTFSLLGFVPIIVGASIVLWCYWQFVFHGRGTPVHFKMPKRLIVKGLYRYVRNPMLIGVILIWAGEIVFYQSWVLLLVLILVHFVVIYPLVLMVEEPMLEAKFGDSYRDYCENVPRWIPRLRPFTRIFS